MAPISYITNIQGFCAAHRLHNPALSDEENRANFGKCNHISSHGHNYKVEVTVMGAIDPELGFVMNLRDLKHIVLQVVDPLDHKRLDTDIEFFNDHISTAENISYYIWMEVGKLLALKHPNVKLHNIRLYETDKNVVDFRGEMVDAK